MLTRQEYSTLDCCYAPIFTYNENEFIVDRIDSVFKTEREAMHSYLAVGMRFMYRGAAFTGRCARIPREAAGRSALSAEWDGGSLLFLSGPIFEKASTREGHVASMKEEVSQFIMEVTGES